VVEGELKASKPDKKLNRYEVFFTSPEERFTKIFTDRLIEEARAFYSELKTKRSREILGILEQRVAQTRLNLNNSITSRAAVQDADLNPAFQEAQAQLQKKQVDISAYGGAYGELYKNLEIARYQYLKSVPLLQVIDGAEYPMKRIKKSRLFNGISYSIFFACLAILGVVLMHFISLVKHHPEKKKHPMAAI
jgi:hypothetical protein